MITESSEKGAKTPHNDQLDGLRAVAILSVLVTHFTPESGLLRVLHYGHPGSRLFFVLSGFFITGLLLRYRADPDRMGVLKRFHIRRLLRTFPLYYLFLIVAAALNIKHVREGLLWHVAFLSDFYMGWFQPPSSVITHLWSLSLQEQFYLVWPFVILFVSQRRLLGTLVAAMLLGPVARVIGTAFSLGDFSTCLPFGCLDSLAGGALLSFVSHKKFGNEKLRAIIVKWSLYVGLVSAPPLLLLEYFHPGGPVFLICWDITLSLLLVFLVDTVARSVGGPIGKLLQWKPVSYVGRISFGIYVLHPLMPIVLFYALKLAKVQATDGTVTWFVILLCLAIAGAMVSWRLVESPINSFKDRFPYSTSSYEKLKAFRAVQNANGVPSSRDTWELPVIPIVSATTMSESLAVAEQ